MQTVASLIDEVEAHAALPRGEEERAFGYGVMGVPFTSGYILGLRRYPASSIGPGYTSVWLRDPAGAWTMYTNVDPAVSCPRYFGTALAAASVHEISVVWTDDRSFTVGIADDVDLRWEIDVKATVVSRAMSLMTRATPPRLWRNRIILDVMAAVARPTLRAGRIGMTGTVPNGHVFTLIPQRIWFLGASRAVLGGHDLGPIGALPVQTRLGDFWIPQRGLFMIGSVLFDPVKSVEE